MRLFGVRLSVWSALIWTSVRVQCALLTASFAFALLIAATAVAAQEISADATLIVLVRDAATQNGVRAIVKLIGPLSELRSTDATGVLKLRTLPPGNYTVQIGGGAYKSSDVIPLSLNGGETYTVRIDLAPRASSLRSIGRVSSAAPRRSGYDVVTANSELRSLAEDLNHAIGNVPGVVLSGSGGNGEPQALYGLEGHDPNQTAITLDGVPLHAVGTSFDAIDLASDLTSSAAVSFGPGPGFTGGTIDYRTASPTRQAVGTVTGEVGADGMSSMIALLRGSYGHLGYVIGNSNRSSDSNLPENAFVDWSGVPSFHTGGFTQHARLTKFQYLLGSSAALSVTSMSTTRNGILTCPLDTTLTPCSFGPGASAESKSDIETIRVAGSGTRMNYSVSVFRVLRSSATNFAGRTIAGSSYPASRGSTSAYGGAAARFELHPSDRNMLAFDLTNSSSHDGFTQTSVFDPPLELRGSDRQVVTRIEAAHRASPVTRLSMQISRRHGASGSGTFVQAGIITQLTPGDALSIRLDAGSGNGSRSVVGSTTEPDFLNFICTGPVAYGRAATIVDQGGATADQRVVYTHAAGTISFSATAFQQIAHDVPFDYPIPASSFPALQIGQYLTNANVVLHLPTVCPGSAPLTTSRLYLYGYVNGIDTRYRGLRVTASSTRGPWRVDPYVSLLRATLNSGMRGVNRADSILRSGDQLTGIPYVQAGFLIDYKKSSTELAANYRYYSRNNSLGAPAFGTLDVAAVFETKLGTLTARTTNLFSTQASPFALVSQVGPMTAAGDTIPFVRKPFSGRRTSVDYTFSLGARTGGEGNGRRLAPASGESTSTPRGLPAEAVTDPFALRNASPGCDFQTATATASLLAPLRAYYDASKRSKPPADLPTLPGAQLRYHTVPTGYEFEISIQSMSALHSLFQCVLLRNVNEDELHAAGFVGSSTSYSGVTLLFTSKFGFLVPTASVHRNPPAYFTIATATPTDLFALTSSDSCSADYRARAEKLLPMIRATIGEKGLGTAFSTAAYDVTVGTSAASKPWVYFEFKDPFDLASVLNCGHISRGTRAQLEAVQLGGAALPYLGFSPAYGFFFYQP